MRRARKILDYGYAFCFLMAGCIALFVFLGTIATTIFFPFIPKALWQIPRVADYFEGALLVAFGLAGAFIGWNYFVQLVESDLAKKPDSQSKSEDP